MSFAPKSGMPYLTTVAWMHDNNSQSESANGQQNYCSVKRQCDELCRVIANDQTQLQNVFATLTEMIDRLQRQQSSEQN
jgi:hypothetical protein